MSFQRFLVLACGDIRKTIFHLFSANIFDRLVKIALIAFQRENVVTTAVANLLGNRLLAACRINSDNPTSNISNIFSLSRKYVGKSTNGKRYGLPNSKLSRYPILLKVRVGRAIHGDGHRRR